MSEEDDAKTAEFERRWRHYFNSLAPGQARRRQRRLGVFRETFPHASPEDFEELWEATSLVSLLPGSLRKLMRRTPSAPQAPPAPPVPPRFGEVLVGLFCKRELREAVLGDLDEKFAELAERRGANVAKAWYWSQAARSALFFAVRWGRRLLELEAILKRIL